ncbi:MAG TPA: biotin synthase BioB [Polyangiaceae bacterium]|nr:biotin synthase BioB [Polyangiaceae bacterium]
MSNYVRHDWTLEQIRDLHQLPLFTLLDRARAVHTAHFPDNDLQLCTLLSVKTGGCPEDCGYCAQSSRHHKSPVQPQAMLDVQAVVAAARRAKQHGATRFCMGAAWRAVKDGPAFEKVLEMIRGVKAEGLEACVTLGMLTEEQAIRLKQAGLDSYNHNIDTSREHYPNIVTTRTFDQRLETLGRVRKAGIGICCGGIIGMGESLDDRCRMLLELSLLQPHPESVPINNLVAIPGTPLESVPKLDPIDVARMIATTRIVLPTSRVRLAAGREQLGREGQILCLYAGANSIFYGEQLLTTPNPPVGSDDELIAATGLQPLSPQLSA